MARPRYRIEMKTKTPLKRDTRKELLLLLSLLVVIQIACSSSGLSQALGLSEEAVTLTPTPVKTPTVSAQEVFNNVLAFLAKDTANEVNVSATLTLTLTVSPTLGPSTNPNLVLTATPLANTTAQPNPTSGPNITPSPTLLGSPTLGATPTPDPNVTPSPTLGPPTLGPTPGPLATIIAQSCPRRQACILSPLMDTIVSDVVEVRGAAYRPDFAFYKFEYQQEGTTEWVLIGTIETAVNFGHLINWATNDVPAGSYWLRLVVVDINGNYWAEETKIRLHVVNETQPTEDPLAPLRYNPTAVATP